ncbi:MAG TPA: hypothetical protein VG499_04045 [Actinomycetota bacterium]|nr:hypothetical protein [Actinomycetota bacterium]
MSLTAVAVSVGLVAGLALAVSGVPRMRRPRLDARLDPYLRGLEPATTRLLDGAGAPLTPLPALERLLGPLLQDGARLVERWLGGAAAVSRRLREAGAPGDVARFRAEQVLWGLAGFVAAVLTTILLPALAGRPVSAVAVVGGAVLGVLGGCSAVTAGSGGRSPGVRQGSCASCPPSPTCSAWRSPRGRARERHWNGPSRVRTVS